MSIFLILRSAAKRRVSKDVAWDLVASWFETPRYARFLTMRIEVLPSLTC
jgi:hypothetical protein